MDLRLKFEYLMLNAFNLSYRKELRFADADFFDIENASVISTVMTAAFCNILKRDSENRDWIENSIRRLESHPEDWDVICQIISDLPIRHQ